MAIQIIHDFYEAPYTLYNCINRDLSIFQESEPDAVLPGQQYPGLRTVSAGLSNDYGEFMLEGHMQSFISEHADVTLKKLYKILHVKKLRRFTYNLQMITKEHLKDWNDNLPHGRPHPDVFSYETDTELKGKTCLIYLNPFYDNTDNGTVFWKYKPRNFSGANNPISFDQSSQEFFEVMKSIVTSGQSHKWNEVFDMREKVRNDFNKALIFDKPLLHSEYFGEMLDDHPRLTAIIFLNYY